MQTDMLYESTIQQTIILHQTIIQTHIKLTSSSITSSFFPCGVCARTHEYMLACIHVSVCMPAYPSACVFQKSTSGVFLRHSPTYFLGQGLSLHPELADSQGKQVSELPGSSCLCFFWAGIIGTLCAAFYVMGS